VGWTVVWNNEEGNAHSVTTWCGRYDPDADLVHATWLLTAEGAEHTGWCSTRVGQDLFVRLEAQARHEGSTPADATSSRWPGPAAAIGPAGSAVGPSAGDRRTIVPRRPCPHRRASPT